MIKNKSNNNERTCSMHPAVVGICTHPNCKCLEIIKKEQQIVKKVKNKTLTSKILLLLKFKG